MDITRPGGRGKIRAMKINTFLKTNKILGVILGLIIFNIYNIITCNLPDIMSILYDLVLNIFLVYILVPMWSDKKQR